MTSRLEAVKYKLAFDRPDTSTDTEPQMNLDPVNGEPISEKRLKERFNSSDFQVLPVANKYQTGFDQPKLSGRCCMTMDRTTFDEV